MIGDYVLVKPSMMLIKVAAVHHKKVGYHAVTHKLNWVRMDLLKPIPLTSEILERNAFELNGELPFRKEFRICFNEDTEDERHLFVEYHHKSDYVKLTYQTYTGHHNGTNGIVINHCGVHQFQHALRICGLDELADNLKLEE
jgi:hypothetical protein